MDAFYTDLIALLNTYLGQGVDHESLQAAMEKAANAKLLPSTSAQTAGLGFYDHSDT